MHSNAIPISTSNPQLHIHLLTHHKSQRQTEKVQLENGDGDQVGNVPGTGDDVMAGLEVALEREDGRC